MESVWHATHPPSHPSNRLVPGTHFDTVVAGAGLTGITTALLLARTGHRVAVLEARTAGAVTTGNTTGKVSLLQGLVLSDIRHHHSDNVLRAYVDGNRAGQAWLLSWLDTNGIDYQRRDAFTYAGTDDGLAALRRELAACEAAGLDVGWSEPTGLPFAIGALRLADQVQIHPLVVLSGLIAEFLAEGGMLIEGARVTGAASGPPVTVSTTLGEVTAGQLVLATGVPILDRGGYFAKLSPHRSYAATYRIPGTIPDGMYLSADEPTRSLRTVVADEEELLIVGGNGHITGRADSPAEAVADLDRWTREHFPGAERVHTWSAQDYRSINRVPFVGALPRGGGDIHVATGFNKWGMTNAVAAALNLTGRIIGTPPPWAETLGRRVTKPAGVASVASLVGGVAVEAARTWVQAELHSLPDTPPAEGRGVTGRVGAGRPVAAATVDGTTCRVSAVCPHMGGIVRWNDAERSWDCPLHGSRFTADGTLLEGPATSDLPPVSDTPPG